MTEKRFGMYQNILYDDGNILNPFDAMKLLNHFDKENTKLKEENEQLKQENKKLHDTIFLLRTELAHQRTEKEKHSDSAYTFLKKLEKW